MIMEEFRAAIPEGGFVLIAFENHFRARAETVTLAEVFGHAADEERGLLARGMENPSEHGRGSGFAVGAADDDGMLAGEKNLFQDFRHGAVRNFALERLFEFGVAASDDVGDDD